MQSGDEYPVTDGSEKIGGEERAAAEQLKQLLAGGLSLPGVYSVFTSKPVGFTALEDVAEAAAVILMEGPEKHGGKDYWFSADALAPDQVAETLTAATGHKFTADVRDVESFAKEVGGPGSAHESAYAKGGPQFFREVEHGRMAYIGSVKRRYKENC